MMSQWLLGVGLSVVLAVSPEAKTDLEAYEAARASVGRDADAHVKLALWCEAHGLTAERVKHLAVAVLTEPKNSAARGLLGLVEYGGRWQRPDSIAATVKADESLTARLAEYNARRGRAKNTADDQWKLAIWCEQNGLQAESVAHFSAVTRLEPSRDAAWKKLGCKKVGGRWLTDEQASAEKAEAGAQRKADQYWKPILTKWKGWLNDKNRQVVAEQNLDSLDDPRAIPSIWAVFAQGDEASQAVAVSLLGRIDSGPSSQALAALSIRATSAETRRKATEILRRRDPRDFVGLLVGSLRDPLKYEVRLGKTEGSVGELFVEGEKYNVDRVYGFTEGQLIWFARVTPRRIYAPSIPFDPFGPENLAFAANNEGSRRDIEIGQQLLRIQALADDMRQQLANDVKAIEAGNAASAEANCRLYAVLSPVTGRDATGSAEEWRKWWTDQSGYAYQSSSSQEKPTLTEFVGNPSIPSALTSHSCFAAGTLVRTLEGTRPIELIRAGDQVLTQDTTTGRLSFAPVLVAYHNKPAPTLRITLESVGSDRTPEAVIATGIHRFWKAGAGWAMARDLKPGDKVRGVGGVVLVSSVSDETVQPVFNLEVGAGQSFFVGKTGLLVHDNSLVDPVSSPFDAPPELASVSSPKR